MLLHESPNLVLKLEGHPRLLDCHWRGFSTGQAYRTNMLQVVDAVRAHSCVGCIADLREFLVTSEEDQKWTVESWYPLVVGAGLRCMAVVVSASAITTLVARRVVSQFGGTDLVTEYFDSHADAVRWLARNAAVSGRKSFAG